MCCQSTFPNGICVHLRTAFLIIFNSKLVELSTTILTFLFRRKKLFVVRRKIQCLYHRIAFPTTMNLIYVNLRTAFLKIINSMLVEFPSTIFLLRYIFHSFLRFFAKEKGMKVVHHSWKHLYYLK